MEVSCSDVETRVKSEAEQEDTYSGEAAFLYSSKINGVVNVAGVCETLIASDAFSFSLDSHGRIYFKENGRLRSQQLNIETTISELGMTVSGHQDFMAANSGSYNAYSFSCALNLLLSDKKLFNASFDFPPESARIFMRPIAIRMEGSDEYEVLVPCLRVYAGGIVSLSLSPMPGFEGSSVREVINKEVDKSRLNIDSALCERDLLLAYIECQISQMPRQERLAQRRELKSMIQSALAAPDELDFLDERLTVYELLHTDKITLTDIARNLLSMVDRAVKLGSLRGRISWFSRQYRDTSIGEYWHGKPIIYIRSHTRQKKSSTENLAAHRHLVNSVMVRVHLNDNLNFSDLACSDMRAFDDFNNFYSESVSLMLSSAQVDSFLENSNSFTFSNLISDVQVLNEASHFINIYYSYASLGVDRCKTAIDVARLELKILKFEESLLSAHKYGEVAKYLDEVKRGGHLTTVCKLLHKKVETVRKALELDEKVSSESYTRRITLIFGIIASATLSPELMQPLAKFYGFTFADEQVGKLVGICASVVVVITFLTLSHYVLRTLSWVARNFRT
jgi:hypothetical protein